MTHTDATPLHTIKVRTARRRFEPGMIVLDPRPDEGGAFVWTVGKVTTVATTLLADYGATQAEAVIRGPESAYVPEGWRVLEHDAIASVFSGDGPWRPPRYRDNAVKAEEPIVEPAEAAGAAGDALAEAIDGPGAPA